MGYFQFGNALVQAHRCGLTGNPFKGLLELTPTLFTHHQLILPLLSLAVGREPIA